MNKKSKNTKFNYRKYYKEYYRIDFDKNFDIHHIDMNRNNNNISNLLLLPKKLHHNFHSLSYTMLYNIKSIISLDLSKPIFQNMSCEPMTESLQLYTKIMCEILLWKQHKDTNYSLYKIDGIKNIISYE